MGWQKGQSGNPQGRRPQAYGDALQALLAKRYGLDARTLVDGLEVLRKQTKDLKTSTRAHEILLAYHSGKPTERHEHTGRDGAPLRVFSLIFPAGEATE